MAVRAAARTVASGRRKRLDWERLDAMERYHVLDAVGGQVLPALIALPDVEVEAGTRPTFTTAQVAAAVEQSMGASGGGRLRRKATVAARTPRWCCRRSPRCRCARTRTPSPAPTSLTRLRA